MRKGGERGWGTGESKGGEKRRRALTILPGAHFSRQQRVTCTTHLPGSVLGSQEGSDSDPGPPTSSHSPHDRAHDVEKD